MSRARLASAYEELAATHAQLAEHYAQVAHELMGTEQPAAGASAPPAPAPVDTSPLGACPVHRVAWTVKAGGISKNGKPYPAFWKCAQRDDDGYCNQKPSKAWADSHPIPLEAA